MKITNIKKYLFLIRTTINYDTEYNLRKKIEKLIYLYGWMTKCADFGRKKLHTHVVYERSSLVCAYSLTNLKSAKSGWQRKISYLASHEMQ